MYICYVVLLALAVLSVTFLCLSKNKLVGNEKKREKILKFCKILVIIYMVLEFFEVWIPDVYALDYTAEQIASLGYRKMAILKWFNLVAFISLPFAVFFKNRRITTKILAFFVIPVALASILFFDKQFALYEQLAQYQANFGIRGLGGLHWLGDPNKFNDLLINPVFRSGLYIARIIIVLFTSTFVISTNSSLLKFENGKEFFKFLLHLICLILTIIPVYVPQQIIGTPTTITMEPFNWVHLCWLAEFAVEIIVITLTQRKTDKENKYILAFVLSLALLLNYHQMFNLVNEVNAHRLPLQLCNIASYLLIITLLTKNEKLYHFTIIANVSGALIALFMLGNNRTDGVLTAWNWHYITEHQNVFVTPIVMLTTGLVNPIKKKDIKDVIKGWLIYFLIVYILGIVFNGLEEITGDGWFNSNYFFLFDLERAKDFLPAGLVTPLFETQITLFDHFHLKLVQPLIFLAFMLLFIGIFFLIYVLQGKKRKQVIVE